MARNSGRTSADHEEIGSAEHREIGAKDERVRHGPRDDQGRVRCREARRPHGGQTAGRDGAHGRTAHPRHTLTSSAVELLARFSAARARRYGSRTLVVCAHPDDETIGAGARLASLSDVTLVYVTDGSPADSRDALSHGFASHDAYVEARRRERSRALALAGVDVTRIVDIGLVDQQASRFMEPLARRLAAMFARLCPDVVLTHPYEGGHPDHDATAFAVHTAVRQLAAAGRALPAVLEMTSYHAADDAMVVGAFLGEVDGETDGTARVVELDPPARALKRRMLACYVTQQRVLNAFPVCAERFRVAPQYDFTSPPHAGRLWYEWFGWGGMTGAHWRALAAEALARVEPASRSA